MARTTIHLPSLEYYRSKRAANDIRHRREQDQDRWMTLTGDWKTNLNVHKAIRAVLRTTECEEALMQIVAILEQYFPSSSLPFPEGAWMMVRDRPPVVG
ncbi:hypothetical protein HBI82_025580 [Parastagonospora nodorum]|nr:hypothetical protein HBI82_025580 [Parastagonospora nodorum]